MLMKKIYLLGLALATFSMANAQTTVIDDNFESYSVGGLNQAHWGNWFQSGADESLDIAVNDRRASSPTKSGYIGVANDNKGQDALLIMPQTYTSGIVTTEWKMYIPADSVAYFNLQETSTPGQFYGFECMINGYDDQSTLQDGTTLDNKMVWTFINEDDSRVIFGYTPFVADQWITVKQVIDLTNSKMNVFVNGAEITYYYYKTDEDAGNVYPGTQKSVASFDFYSLPDTSNVNGYFSSYYIDDVKITTQPSTTGISNISKNSNLVSLYPNPSKDYINLSIDDAIMNEVEVYNVAGQKVYSSMPNTGSTKLNVKGFANGMYTVKIKTKDNMYTKQFVVK